MVVLLAALAGGCASQPKTHYDCVLQTVKAGMGDEAVSALTKACRSKFPKKDIMDRLCSEEELNALTGRAKHSYGSFEGILHNSHRDTRVLAAEIGVTTTIDGEEVSLLYEADFPGSGLLPLGTARFDLPIVMGDADATYGWYIADAMCMEKRK